MPLKDCPHPLCHRENDELIKSHAELLEKLKLAAEVMNANGQRSLAMEFERTIAEAEKVTP